MLKKIFVALTLAGIMTAAAAPKAEAVPISGTINFAGLIITTPVGSGLAGATGITFVNTVGTPFLFGTTGDYNNLAPLTQTTFTNFTFNPASTPVTPLWTATSGAYTASFDLSTIAIVLQNANNLNLSGTGTLFLTGFSPTPGRFAFSSQNSAGGTGPVFSFSADNSTVPEPGSMLLLGTGLMGLGAAARRRFSRSSK